jgi:hypothetical protein
MKKKNHQTLSMTFFSNTVKYYLEFKKKTLQRLVRELINKISTPC